MIDPQINTGEVFRRPCPASSWTRRIAHQIAAPLHVVGYSNPITIDTSSQVFDHLHLLIGYSSIFWYLSPYSVLLGMHLSILEM